MLNPKRTAPGLLLAVLLPLLLLGCSESSDPDEADSSPTQAVPEATATQETGQPSPPNPQDNAPPGTTATSEGAVAEMGVGTYCWTTMCVDMIGPITRETLRVAAGAEVIVAVPDGAPPLNEVSVEAFEAENPQVFDNGTTAWQPNFDIDGTMAADWDAEEVRVVADLEPGTYVLVVGMFFESGDVQYGVVLEVV